MNSQVPRSMGDEFIQNLICTRQFDFSLMKNNILLFALVCSFGLILIPEAKTQCSFNPETGEWVTPGGTPCPNAVNTGVPFLRITPDARAGALGDAGTALSPDANAMHHNASRLAFVEDDMALSATYTPWLRGIVQDVYMAYLSGYKKLENDQAIGLALRYFSLGDVQFTDENGESLGTGRPNEFEVNAGYARKLGERFSASVSAKFIYSNLAAGQNIGNVEITAATSVAADLGLTYQLPLNKREELQFGLALTNLGAKVSYTESIYKDFLPANFSLGTAYTIDFDEYNSLTLIGEVNKLMAPTPIHPESDEFDENGNGVPDYREQSVVEGIINSWSDAPEGFEEELREFNFSFGAEYWYDQQFAVRTGYFTEHRLKGNRKYLTLGLGIKYNVFGLNFSYLVPTNGQRNPLDNTLRFSLIFDFEAFKAGSTEEG